MESIGIETALCCLAPRQAQAIRALPDGVRESIREIRLRVCKPVIVNCENEPFFIFDGGRISRIYSACAIATDVAELQQTFRALCGYSVHACQSSVNGGYITIEGGHRAGVCGTAVCEGGAITAVRDISCINIRIARQVKGAAGRLFADYFVPEPVSMIVAGAPLSGKTTLLRDLAFQLSGEGSPAYAATCICDERGEIAAVYKGIAQNDVGLNCDVLTGYPKGEAVMIALRSFSPRVIICDEVGAGSEIAAIREGVNSGVKFVVSVHAASEQELASRAQIKELMQTGAFQYVALLEGADAPCKIQKIYKVGDLLA